MFPRNNYVELAAGILDGTTLEDLDRMFAAVEQSSTPDHLAVHFHGGLVSRESAEKAASSLLPAYQAGGAYPVFFFWRSDLWTVISHELPAIAQEPIFQRLVKLLVRLAIGRLRGHTGARAGGPMSLSSPSEVPSDPEALAAYAAAHEPDREQVAGATLSPSQKDQAATELETDQVLRDESAAIAKGIPPPAADAAPDQPTTPPEPAGTRGADSNVPPRASRMSGAVRTELRLEHAKSGARGGIGTAIVVARRAVAVLARVVDRYSRHRDHGLHTTIVEEVLREFYLDSIGAGVWKSMKKHTLDAFGSDPQRNGGTAFLARLKAWWKPGRRVTLIGHSTGAIYIGHFLEQVDPLLDPAAKFNVVFLAPACTFTFLAERLEVFRRRVSRLQLFGLKDELEHGYWEVPVLFPGSLLYMVSGMFEADMVDMPLVGMQRYYSGAEPYLQSEIGAVTTYLRDHCVWSLAEGTAGLNSGASKHGGFDLDKTTLESVTAFFQEPKG